MAAAGSDEHDYLPISERPEWAGVRPLAPPPTPSPLVAIARDPLQGDLMDYFWAAVARGELSERVLGLTGEIISDLNSSNYTVWEWRWRCVEALGGAAAHAAAEQALTRSVATANPKNYQLWNHRRRLALVLGAAAHADEEMAFTAACLAHDAKNYHAWAHRQALLLAASAEAGGGAGGGGAATAAAAAVAGLWSAELAFMERLLREDVRNNSAWNQRIFVLRNAPPAAVGLPAEAYAREVEFAAAQARTAPHSESAWEVLRELAGGPGAPPHALASDARYLAACREVLDAAPGCSPALALLADVLLAQAALLGEAAEAAAAREGGDGAGKAAAASGAPPLDRRHAAAAAVEARRLARLALERLAATDPLRRPFWRLELAALA